MTQNLNILLLIPTVISVLSLGVAYYLVTWIKKQETGTNKMKEIAAAIHEGSNAFLKRQYKTIAIIAVILGAVLVMLDSNTFQAGKMTLRVGWILGLAFLFGALCSGVAGLVGMWIAVRANLRTASGAQKGLSKALDVATKAGAISGITITAMSLLGISILYAFCLFVLKVEAALIPNLIAGFGFGASLVALFAQLGGGIYTKAADVGADLVGKIEQNIPEDDPRNPAVVADLVGDNVGDCAGRGADLFESTAAENIAAMILGAALLKDNPALGISVVFFPLILRAVGLICSMIGLLFAKGTDQEDPMAILNKGYYVTCFLAVLAFLGVIYTTFNSLTGWFNLFLAGLVGILASLAFVWITQYYTSSDYRPIKEIVKSSRTGHATNIIAGLSVGLESTASTVIIIGTSLLMSFELGKLSGLQGPDAGIYGTAIATMGMLATAAYILTMDTFGPITDNAGGIVEMSDQPESVREVTDKLDTVGNTTKALTKGYAMGSAALSAFLLFSAYMTDSGLKSVDFAKVEVFVGALVGGMLVFLFSALAMKAVGHAAGSIVEEVRRQFKENPGLMAGTQKPDYGKCVDITTLAALKEMVVPGVLAVIVPIFIGYFFKAEAAGGLIMAGTIVGVLLATVMNNAGGAWDNAKKYIEKGHEGGKGSTTHAASVTGDTVGDPFKDTAGPSLHVLVKLLGTLSLALVAIFK